MFVALNMNFDDLAERCNDDSATNYYMIEQYDLEDKFMDLLYYRYSNDCPTIYEINTFTASEAVKTWILRNTYVHDFTSFTVVLDYFNIEYNFTELVDKLKFSRNIYNIASVLDIIMKYLPDSFTPCWDFLDKKEK